MIALPKLALALALAVSSIGCSRETEVNPDYQAGSGATSGSGANGGSGGSSATGGDDAGGTGGIGGDAGGVGGTGGDGGTAGGGQGGDGGSTDCDDNAMCSAALPQCNAAGKCVSCTSNAACDDRDPLAHCETTTSSDRRGECVACTEDDHCEGNEAGEYCNNNACVPCKTNTDCTDPTKPQCSPEGQCVGCTDSEACEGRDGTEVCRNTPGPNRGHCVACVAHTDCPNADAPQCTSDNTCGACTQNAACSFRDAAPRCNLRTGAETFGECVECTGATEDDDCDGNSCKQSTGECTGTGQGSRNPCQSCEADSECGDGAKCVQHTLGAMPLGHFCFYTYDANDGCADTRPGIKPYSQSLPNTRSIDATDDSQQATYCLPVTSCEALDDASGVVAPGDSICTTNADCGVENVNDGQCIERGMPDELRCSYICEQDYECPQDLSKCLGAGTKVCSP